jgi:hypothetical protein
MVVDSARYLDGHDSPIALNRLEIMPPARLARPDPLQSQAEEVLQPLARKRFVLVQVLFRHWHAHQCAASAIEAANRFERAHGLIRPSVDLGRLGRCQLGKLLAEDLVHHLSASGKGGHDLMPVDQLCRGGLVVPGEQRDRLDRHAMG